jgi:hypothetical protein
VIRSAAAIAAAIEFAAPGMSPATALAYARVVRPEAIEHRYDPFTMVAYVRRESRWNPRVVGGLDGQCIGLGGICLHKYRECTETRFTGEVCLAHKARLLDGAHNLRVASSMVTAHREFCRNHTGRRALFARWLSSLQGYNNSRGRRGVWCNMRKDRRGRWRDVRAPEGTRAVMRYRLVLVRRFG